MATFWVIQFNWIIDYETSCDLCLLSDFWIWFRTLEHCVNRIRCSGTPSQLCSNVTDKVNPWWIWWNAFCFSYHAKSWASREADFHSDAENRENDAKATEIEMTSPQWAILKISCAFLWSKKTVLLIQADAVCVGNLTDSSSSLETVYVFKFVRVKSSEVHFDCYPILTHIVPSGSPCTMYNYAGPLRKCFQTIEKLHLNSNYLTDSII